MDDNVARAGVFRGIDRDVLVELAKSLPWVTFARRQTIFVEGQAGDCLYIIAEGKVKIGCKGRDGRQTLITLLGPSDMLGELSIFDPAPRSSTAVALTRVRAVVMEGDTLRAWVGERPEIADQLLRLLARRIRRTNDIVSDLVFNDVPGRVAQQLLLLTKRFGVRVGTSWRVDHGLSQEEIAQLAGTSRETANKALTDFAEADWITIESKSVLIHDFEQLAARASSAVSPVRRA
ncbi:Crp/Fnr family transcriptional regulator [Mycobacterium vicinigordonae]|uniref:CRP-like cAMP-activated global transcriptional regulator n=1 Tax=Mycobacterium vicinigordonae TaxID=1719132 RepID=A0A7D6DYK1_9MYCO|nr:Crp/Fnr family transcriptional regulator [Mycobacterium vicinigordonae]QLL07608.1 Crp/Fnr family transcriptional regulator [Mycobacterium vicinigordonae]